MVRTAPVTLMVLLTIAVSCIQVSANLIPPPEIDVVEEKADPIRLSSVDMNVRILDHIAESQMTMTFYNPNRSAMTGDLYFPLPEGSTVSGYALDIEGKMVDGVAVEKDKGRRVFEEIVRQGIDPGLVEQVAGNNFKTRIFPIPAMGTRTVSVSYLSDLVIGESSADYYLPVRFETPLDLFKLRVEVIKPESPPQVQGSGSSDLLFQAWNDSFVAETTLENQAFTDDIVIALPNVTRRKSAVQKASDGKRYFYINDAVPKPSADVTSAPSTGASRIVILWDASGSRGKRDHLWELSLLESYFADYAAPSVDVSLILFRHKSEVPMHFHIENGNAQALIAELEAVQYDGGTQMAASSPMLELSSIPDFYLLFSDGLSTFGEDEPEGFHAPLYAVSNDATANHAFLRYITQKTGGDYFNLNTVDDLTVLSKLGVPPYNFISATYDATKSRTPTPTRPARYKTGSPSSENSSVNKPK